MAEMSVRVVKYGAATIDRVDRGGFLLARAAGQLDEFLSLRAIRGDTHAQQIVDAHPE